MNYIGSKKLETENLILRSTEEKDLKVLWEILCDVDVSKYYLVGKFNLDWEKEKEWQYKKLARAGNQDVFQWSIILKSTNECIGQISCQKSYDTNGNLQDDNIRDVGWFLNSNYHNFGFGTEAAKAMLNYMFNEVGIDRIETSSAVDNLASWKLMEKLGFIRYTEKTHKTKYTFLIEEVDCYSYRITKEEYLSKRR
ncbi:MAG: GNAT family N-acetyltransferase [Bacilli bacterium]|nr:GNAT family N-acetyltransferase [Bacilli bacterium]MDD4298394.1 GNAT family N-acetyltransferase [Bacilli bacterium]MDD4643609.1 GNAT family N-acetyltransferase [Bacilli bacterium]